MKLSLEIKNKIKEEYNEWFNSQYGDKTLEERRGLGAFFTPPELTIKMIEKFNTIENKTILDPTCGTGNLLAGCIIAGADPTLIYGNEFDPTFMQLCRDRLEKLGVPKYNIHQGDALISKCIELSSFTPQYNYEKIKQLHEKGNRVSLW